MAPHRSAAELQRLAALPLSERSAAEKEAVRNARKREKWKEKKAAAAVAAASLPVLHIPSPPRTADERLRTLQERKQVEEDDSIDDENSARIEVDVWKQREKLAQIVSTATADENAAWASAEKTFADSIIGVVAREVKRRRGDHCAGISSSKADTIQANVHTWASTARLQGKCTGTADTHAHAPHGLCPGPFSPSTFFLHGVVQFAHWKDHKRNNDPCQLIRNRCRADDNDSFVKWLAANGRFLYACCHAIESARESRIPSIPP